MAVLKAVAADGVETNARLLVRAAEAEASLASREAEARALRAVSAELSDHAAELQRRLDDAVADCGQQARSIDELLAEVQQRAAVQGDMQAAYSDLDALNNRLMEALEHGTAQLRGARAKLASMQAAVEAERDARADAVAEQAMAAALHAELEASFGALAADHEALRARYDHLAARHTALRDRHEELQVVSTCRGQAGWISDGCETADPSFTSFHLHTSGHARGLGCHGVGGGLRGREAAAGE